VKNEFEKLGKLVSEVGARNDMKSAEQDCTLASFIKQLKHCGNVLQCGNMLQCPSLDTASFQTAPSVEGQGRPTLPVPDKIHPNEKLSRQPQLYMTRKPYRRKVPPRFGRSGKRVRKRKTAYEIEEESSADEDMSGKRFEEAVPVQQIDLSKKNVPQVSSNPNSSTANSRVSAIYQELYKKSFTPPIESEESLDLVYFNSLYPTFGISLSGIKSLDPYITDVEADLIRSKDSNFMRGYLTSEVIDFYLLHLTSDYLRMYPSHTCSIIPSRLITVAQDLNDIRQILGQIKEESLPILTSDILIFPFQERPMKNHWSLIVLNVSKSVAIVLDPMYPQRPKNPRQLEDFIVKWNEVDRRCVFKEIVYPHHVTQTDGTTCGVFVCYYAHQLLLSGQPLCALKQPFDVDEYRKKIYNVITENGTVFLQMPDVVPASVAAPQSEFERLEFRNRPVESEKCVGERKMKNLRVTRW